MGSRAAPNTLIYSYNKDDKVTLNWNYWYYGIEVVISRFRADCTMPIELFVQCHSIVSINCYTATYMYYIHCPNCIYYY